MVRPITKPKFIEHEAIGINSIPDNGEGAMQDILNRYVTKVQEIKVSDDVTISFFANFLNIHRADTRFDFDTIGGRG